MTPHPVIISILLGLAVVLTLACSFGVMVMRDAYQRLQFPTPIVSIAAGLITIAVFIHNPDPASRIKMVIIFLVMFVMNGVLSHATARATRIQHLNRWPLDPDEKIPYHGTDTPAPQDLKH